MHELAHFFHSSPKQHMLLMSVCMQMLRLLSQGSIKSQRCRWLFILQSAEVNLIKLQNGVFSSIASVQSGSHCYGECKCREATAS